VVVVRQESLIEEPETA